MKYDKKIFISVLNELLEEEGYQHKDIYKQTSIARTTLDRILDITKPTMPTPEQLDELCEMLETTLYYLLYRKGPRQVSESVIEKMLDIMTAYNDRKNKPNAAALIDQIITIQDDDSLFMLRKVATGLIDGVAALKEKAGMDATGERAALQRRQQA